MRIGKGVEGCVSLVSGYLDGLLSPLADLRASSGFHGFAQHLNPQIRGEFRLIEVRGSRVRRTKQDTAIRILTLDTEIIGLWPRCL